MGLRPGCSQDFPRASPSGTTSGKGVYLTVYPSSHPNKHLVFKRRQMGELEPQGIHPPGKNLSLSCNILIKGRTMWINVDPLRSREAQIGLREGIFGS